MAEAHNVIKKHKGKLTNVGYLDPKKEPMLGRLMKKKYGNEFVFVTDWPIKSRPFYHMRYSDKPKITKSFDLLYRGIEITTRAQRENRYYVLVKQAKEKKISPKSIQFYLNFFKYGIPSHVGEALIHTRIIK